MASASNTKWGPIKEKARALWISDEVPRTQIADKLGIARSTLYKWATNEEWNTLGKAIGEMGELPENVRHAWLKGKGFSLFVKADQFSLEEATQNMVDEVRKYAPKYPPLPPVENPGEHLLVISTPDPHIGKLSTVDETGHHYDIETAVQRCIDGVAGLVAKAEPYALGEILFIIGNDVLHIDNKSRGTTKGTPQDTDGQWWQMVMAARDMYIKVIESLIPLTPRLVVKFNQSNHDFHLGFMLAQILEAWFRHVPNIDWDVTINPRKYHRYGANLIGCCHQDGVKISDLPQIMAIEAREHWGNTRHAHWYTHHVHHRQRFQQRTAKDMPGCTIESLRSPAAPDAWHHKHGYISPKSMEAFLHHREHGQVSRFTHHFA